VLVSALLQVLVLVLLQVLALVLLQVLALVLILVLAPIQTLALVPVQTLALALLQVQAQAQDGPLWKSSKQISRIPGYRQKQTLVQGSLLRPGALQNKCSKNA